MEQQQNEKKKENRIFDENIIQVTDTISTINIYWDAKKTEELPENFIHHNNMKILATCIGRMIEDSNEQEIVLFDVAAHGNWESATIDSIYGIGKSKGLLGLYFISLGKVNVSPQQLVPLKIFNINAKDAAITFDGDWILNDTSNVFSLRTEDAPWIFYITNTGKLYRKHGTTASATLMAENIELVAAERGYFPEGHLELDSDQGVVVVYLKNNGELVYRSYAYSSATGEKEWFAEEVIDTFEKKTVKNISIHRLNDYRMGVCVSILENNKYKNLWYITDRCYAQMAFRPERFFIQNTQIYKPIYGYINYDSGNEVLVQPNWEWEINEEHDIVTLTSDLSFVFFNGYEDYLITNGQGHSFFTATNADYPIYKIELINDHQINVLFSQKLRRSFSITFTPQPNINFAIKTKCESGGGWATVTKSTTHTFDITNIIEYNNSKETFEISNPVIDIAEIQMHFIEKIGNDNLKETFKISNQQISNASIQMHPIYTTKIDIQKDNFEISNITLEKVTVDDITIISTIPI